MIHAVYLSGLFLVVFLTAGRECLQCYMCPVTGEISGEAANLECLALGWEMTCASNQDRCYSSTTSNTTAVYVEKGCARSQMCLGTTTCCQGDYCNADPQNSLTGYGNTCTDLSDCIQGFDVMRCALRNQNEIDKRCLCTRDSYNEGAICRMKSNPDGPCRLTSHCLDVNSTCLRHQCTCKTGLYANATLCLQQKGLGEICTSDKECRGSNTACNGIHCACAYGFTAVNGTDSCSGSARPQCDCAGLLIFFMIYVMLSVMYYI